MSNERKHHAPEEKVAIVRRHPIDKVSISTLCDEHQLHPTVFCRWLKLVAQAFAPRCIMPLQLRCTRRTRHMASYQNLRQTRRNERRERHQ
jgi:transposase-like protein